MNYLATITALCGKLATPNEAPYIVILGPYHRIHRANEGWVSRVRAIDRALASFNRIYVNFSTEGKLFFHGQRATIFSTYPWIAQYNLNSHDTQHLEIFAKLMNGAAMCYAHNLHLAEHALPWVDSGKVITDMHGAVPEEEAALGQMKRSDHFCAIERQLVSRSKHIVVVSSTLKKHLQTKYPKSECEFIKIPICENITPAPRHRRPDSRHRIIYCGSNHVWQNIDAMLDAVQTQANQINASFYSHRHQAMRQQANNRTPGHAIRFAQVKKSALPKIYAHHDLGFILRDDTTVNQVACPTKLYEYLKCGIVPIVRSPHLGDFQEYGYQFISETDFKLGKFPSDKDINSMQQANYNAACKLEADYRHGIECLIYAITSARKHS